MIQPEIVKASLQNLLEIQTLGIQTFRETFAVHDKEKNVQAYLDKAFSTEQLQKEMNDNNALCYVAMVEAK